VKEIRYVYRPYHPWRHGYRREKLKRGFFLAVRILFVLEVLMFAGAYIKAHTSAQVTEENVTVLPDGEDRGDVYGIGIGAGDGSLFWFHRSRQVEEH